MAEASDKGGGFDWGGLLSGIGKTLSGTAAGLQGDNDYFNRLQTQMDNAAERAKRTQLAQDELKAREEDRAVTRSKNVMETLKMAQEIADQVGGDPERARLPARMLKTILEKNLDGGTIDEKEMQDFLAGGPGSFDGILAAYEGITAAGLDKTPGFQQALRKGKLDLKEWNKTGREQMSNVAYQAASQFAQAHPEDAKTMTWDQFQAKIPGAKFASEEDIYRLQSEHGYTIKPPAQLKKEKESDVTEARQRELRAEQDINTERRHQETLAETQRLHGATIALGQGNLAMRQQEFESRQEARDRLSQSEREPMENMQQAFRLTNELRNAHAEATKGDKPISGALRGYLMDMANSGPRKMVQISKEQLDKLSPAERTTMAKINTVVGNLRAMTPERQLSNEDAMRNLLSFMLSNSPKQVQANLQERLRDQEMSFNSRRENIRGAGKNIPPNLERVDVQVGAETPATAAATAVAPTKVYKVGDRVKNPQTGETVEFDGKAWIKVKK